MSNNVKISSPYLDLISKNITDDNFAYYAEEYIFFDLVSLEELSDAYSNVVEAIEKEIDEQFNYLITSNFKDSKKITEFMAFLFKSTKLGDKRQKYYNKYIKQLTEKRNELLIAEIDKSYSEKDVSKRIVSKENIIENKNGKETEIETEYSKILDWSIHQGNFYGMLNILYYDFGLAEVRIKDGKIPDDINELIDDTFKDTLIQIENEQELEALKDSLLTASKIGMVGHKFYLENIDKLTMSNVRKKIQEEENQKNKIVSLETNDGKIFGDYQSLYHLDKKEVYYKFLNNLLYFYCLAEVEITKQGKISEETKNRMNLNLSVALFNCNNKEDLYNIIDVLSKASRLGKIGYEFYQENSSKLNMEYVNSLKKFKPKSNEKQETEKKQQKQINLDVEDFKRHYRFVLQEYEEFMDFRVKKSEDIENLLSSFLRMKNTIEDEIYMQLGREESEKYLADINKKRNSLYKLQDYISEIGDDSFGL